MLLCHATPVTTCPYRGTRVCPMYRPSTMEHCVKGPLTGQLLWPFRPQVEYVCARLVRGTSPPPVACHRATHGRFGYTGCRTSCGHRPRRSAPGAEKHTLADCARSLWACFLSQRPPPACIRTRRLRSCALAGAKTPRMDRRLHIHILGLGNRYGEEHLAPSR